MCRLQVVRTKVAIFIVLTQVCPCIYTQGVFFKHPHYNILPQMVESKLLALFHIFFVNYLRLSYSNLDKTSNVCNELLATYTK